MFTRIAIIPAIASKISKVRINVPGALLYLLLLAVIAGIAVEFISDLIFYRKSIEPEMPALLYKNSFHLYQFQN
jgi:hypothetical protein